MRVYNAQFKKKNTGHFMCTKCPEKIDIVSRVKYFLIQLLLRLDR